MEFPILEALRWGEGVSLWDEVRRGRSLSKGNGAVYLNFGLWTFESLLVLQGVFRIDGFSFLVCGNLCRFLPWITLSL